MEPYNSQSLFQATCSAARVLKKAKLRVTPWRKRLVNILMLESTPLSRVELGERLSGFDLPVAPSTLKYLVDDFVAAGILEIVEAGTGERVRYRRRVPPNQNGSTT